MTRKIEVLFAEHVESLKMIKVEAFTLVSKTGLFAYILETVPMIINEGGRSLPF